eukprot:CAMPEP_0169274370 /NCGR_PEP_ID=MMETSP1016-20121227/51682_1 /TAXON_ID=342587 /ORGANISM="Karlodinium micrum, Strain CCMP2283" /LENGTH=75 /DNA_ID=CAMNT_0009360913 /DNA_START=319 /DNA_END=547 /DNA_ORIENTATION=-
MSEKIVRLQPLFTVFARAAAAAEVSDRGATWSPSPCKVSSGNVGCISLAFAVVPLVAEVAGFETREAQQRPRIRA